MALIHQPNKIRRYSLKRLHRGRLQTCHPQLNLWTARMHVSQIESSAVPGRVFMRTDNGCCFTVECLQAERGRERGRKREGRERKKQNKLIKDASNPKTPGVTSLAGYTDLENNKQRDGARDKKRSRGYGGRRGVGERWRGSSGGGSGGGVISGVSQAPGCQ